MSGAPAWHLRPARPEDEATLAGIFARSWAAGHPYAPRRIDLAVFRRETAERVLVVAEAPGPALLGFVGVDRPHAFIHHLYVDPAASRRGVGQALLAAGVALAGGRASLKCQLRNERALAFYEALGWQRGETGASDGQPWVRMLSPGA